MKDIMYRVNLRDRDFMQVQGKLQAVNGRKSNVDPEGIFTYSKHQKLAKKLDKSPNESYISRKMTHFVATREELVE